MGWSNFPGANNCRCIAGSARSFVKTLARYYSDDKCATLKRSRDAWDSLMSGMSIRSRLSGTVLNFVIVSKRHFESVNVTADTFPLNLDLRSCASANTKSSAREKRKLLIPKQTTMTHSKLWLLSRACFRELLQIQVVKIGPNCLKTLRWNILQHTTKNDRD